MAIEVNYRQATGLFLDHLRERNISDGQLESFTKMLQGSLKRFIAEELTVYRLDTDKIPERYSKIRHRRFACAAARLNAFIKTNPSLQTSSFADAVAELLKDLSELSVYTKKKTRNTLFKIVCFDIDDLPVSQIPQKAIRACMSKSSRYSLVRGKRFFRFLIHSNLLDSKYLPLHVDVIETFIGQIDDCDRGPLAVEQACAIFVKHLLEETRLRYGAIKTKYYHIRSFARFIGAKKRIEYINRDDIIGYLNHLEIDRGYSQASKATVLTSIRRFFAFFAAQGLMKANVTANITIKKVKKVDKTALCEEDLARVFEAAYLEYQRYEDIINPDSTETQKRWLAARNWAIICLLICTGVRRKEIMSLKTDSIDFAQRVIRIEGKGDNRHHIRQRTIPVTEPIALSAAEIYLSLRPKSIFDYFFLSNHLEPLREQGFACVVEHMKQQLFPQRSLTITQIRKSFVSLCAEKGIDPLVLRQIMGHKSLATTMKYYLTVREQHLRELWEQNNPLLYFSEKEFEQWTI